MNESKSAFAAIVGKANVGKSSILNRLIGSKIAIVSGKPQTTRTKIMGVLTTDDNVQLVFTDTPGFFKPKDKLGEYMVEAVRAHREIPEKAETLGDIIAIADKRTRLCMMCNAIDTCKWSENEKNTDIVL